MVKIISKSPDDLCIGDLLLANGVKLKKHSTGLPIHEYSSSLLEIIDLHNNGSPYTDGVGIVVSVGDAEPDGWDRPQSLGGTRQWYTRKVGLLSGALDVIPLLKYEEFFLYDDMTYVTVEL